MAEGDVEFGHVVDLTLGEPSGTELVADAAIGATTLTVDYAGDFEDAGEVVLNGSTLAYTSIAYGAAETDPDVITLAAPLAAAAVVDDKVVRVSGGEPLSDWLLHVSLGDGHPVDIPIPFEQRALWSSVDTSTPVPVMVSADLERLVEVPGREPQIDGAFIDPTSTIPGGQAFSLDAPVATDGYPEDYGWWQVDASGNVLGFWRLVGGVWTSQAIVTAEALKANNALITALTGETITGTTIQTRATQDRGIKLGEVKGSTNYDEAFIVFNESGVPFIKAVPAEELAVIAGEIKANSLTVAPTSAEEGTSLGGVTEVTRHPDGTPGVLRLTGYTTPPKSAPTVSGGYDSVQFTNDGKWVDRHGWTTDGTYWYTARQSGSTIYAEKWASGGTKVTETELPWSGSSATCVVHSGKVYVLFLLTSFWYVGRFTASSMAYDGFISQWLQPDGNTRAPAVGVDTATSELLIAQARPSDATIPDRVRIRRYALPTDSTPLTAGASVDTAFAFAQDLAGVLYGTHDLGANRYIFANTGGGQFQVVDTTGAEVTTEAWQSGMDSRAGFTYTGGAFVSMDTTGLMRTYTGQDKTTAIGSPSLNKWVSNTLANATLETTQSPTGSKHTIRKRTRLNVTTSGINTGGANAPDRVKIYVGQDRSATVGTTNASPNLSGTFTAADVGGAIVGSGIQADTTIVSQTGTAAVMSKNATATAGSVVATLSPGRVGMWKQADPATGVITTTYPSLATSGTNPPSTNGFQASVGTIQRLELADGTILIDGVGSGSAWTAYTPTFTAATTNPTLASFTITGRYARLGRNAITFSVVITATAASGYGSGTYSFGLPVAARAADEIVVTAAQTGPNHSYVGRSSGGSTSVITLLLTSTDTAINPTTSGMASGTVLRISGTYEAA